MAVSDNINVTGNTVPVNPTAIPSSGQDLRILSQHPKLADGYPRFFENSNTVVDEINAYFGKDSQNAKYAAIYFKNNLFKTSNFIQPSLLGFEYANSTSSPSLQNNLIGGLLQSSDINLILPLINTNPTNNVQVIMTFKPLDGSAVLTFSITITTALTLANFISTINSAMQTQFALKTIPGTPTVTTPTLATQALGLNLTWSNFTTLPVNAPYNMLLAVQVVTSGVTPVVLQDITSLCKLSPPSPVYRNNDSWQVNSLVDNRSPAKYVQQSYARCGIDDKTNSNYNPFYLSFLFSDFEPSSTIGSGTFTTSEDQDVADVASVTYRNLISYCTGFTDANANIKITQLSTKQGVWLTKEDSVKTSPLTGTKSVTNARILPATFYASLSYKIANSYDSIYNKLINDSNGVLPPVVTNDANAKILELQSTNGVVEGVRGIKYLYGNGFGLQSDITDMSEYAFEAWLRKQEQQLLAGLLEGENYTTGSLTPSVIDQSYQTLLLTAQNTGFIIPNSIVFKADIQAQQKVNRISSNTGAAGSILQFGWFYWRTITSVPSGNSTVQQINPNAFYTTTTGLRKANFTNYVFKG